jgi:hypothetical protein
MASKRVPHAVLQSHSHEPRSVIKHCHRVVGLTNLNSPCRISTACRCAASLLCSPCPLQCLAVAQGSAFLSPQGLRLTRGLHSPSKTKHRAFIDMTMRLHKVTLVGGAPPFHHPHHRRRRCFHPPLPPPPPQEVPCLGQCPISFSALRPTPRPQAAPGLLVACSASASPTFLNQGKYLAGCSALVLSIPAQRNEGTLLHITPLNLDARGVQPETEPLYNRTMLKLFATAGEQTLACTLDQWWSQHTENKQIQFIIDALVVYLWGTVLSQSLE